MTILTRFLPHIAVAVVILAIGVWINRVGYESGYNASESKWQPRFAKAERERDAANAKARQTEADSRALSEHSERTNAEQMASLTSRAAAADERIRQLMRDNRGSCCGELPEAGRSAPDAHATSSFDERSERAGADLVALAHRCEADAIALTSLQEWIRGQHTLVR